MNVLFFSHCCLFLPSQVNDLTRNKKHDDVTNRVKPMELPRIRGTLPDLLPPFNQRRDPPVADENEKNQTSLPILLRRCTASKPRRQHKNRDHGPVQSIQKKMQASRMRFGFSKMLQTRPDHEVLLELNVLSPTTWRLLHSTVHVRLDISRLYTGFFHRGRLTRSTFGIYLKISVNTLFLYRRRVLKKVKRV